MICRKLRLDADGGHMIHDVLRLLVAVSVCALSYACTPARATPLVEAFDHYEAIRVSLSGDTLDDVGEHAEALAPLASQVGGDAAGAAASRLAGATTLTDARLEFLSVSTALVPKFLEAKLPGVHGFMCPINDGSTASWAQRSDQIQNPYFGKAMLDCGAKIPTPE